MILILCMLFSCVRDSVNETNASRYFINLHQNMENVSVCLTQFWELCEPLSSNLPDLYPSVKDRTRPHLRSRPPVVPKMQTINIPGTLHIPLFFHLFFNLGFALPLHITWYVHELVENLHVPCHMRLHGHSGQPSQRSGLYVEHFWQFLHLHIQSRPLLYYQVWKVKWYIHMTHIFLCPKFIYENLSLLQKISTYNCWMSLMNKSTGFAGHLLTWVWKPWW